jgi:hypothetical protein
MAIYWCYKGVNGVNGVNGAIFTKGLADCHWIIIVTIGSAMDHYCHQQIANG